MSKTATFDESRLTLTDPVARMIEQQVLVGIDEINRINEILMQEETGTSVRDIDKALKAEAEKENSDLDATTLKAFKDAQEAYTSYRELVEQARNSYRKNVLGEEEKSTATVDEDEKAHAQEVRKAITDAVKFLHSYAVGNGIKEVQDWANSVEVPGVGRKGTSTVGQKKPRVFVFIDDSETPVGSLTEAAKEVSDKDNKVTAGDLAAAWNEATGGEDGEFKFGDHTFRTVAKKKD